MYVENLTTLIVEATKELFDDNFPYPDMKDISVHTEYPLDVAQYPGLWVEFVPQAQVVNVGIGHVERKVSDEGGVREVFRWRFGGALEITAHALGSLERARMIDWIAKAIAFGHTNVDNSLGNFRRRIEQNDLVGVNVLWESFTVSGFAETPGTPWGTDDVVYEGSVTLTIEGEFAFDPNEGDLIPLSALIVDDPLIFPEINEPNPGDGWR